MTAFFDVRPGEGRVVAVALAFAFLCVGAQTFAFISSDTLFVSAFDLGALSRFYLVSAVLRVVVSLAYGALSVRFDGPRFDAGFLGVTALSMLASFPAARSGAPVALYAACVALVLLPSILPLMAIGTALDCFHARQARRILPLVAAAATLGAIVMGGAAKLVSHALGTPSLILLATLVTVIAIPLPAVIAARAEALAGTSGTAERSAAPPSALSSIVGGFTDMRSVEVVRIFALNAVLASAMTVLVDYAFKSALKARYDRDEMAGFLGLFNLLTEAAVLFTQLALTTRIVGWLGVRRALTARPALLVPLAGLLALAPGTVASTSIKLVEMLMRLSVGGTVADLLLAPTPALVRSRAKMLAKAVALPSGALLAGGLLSSFGAAGPGPRTLAAIIGATALLSVAALSRAGRAYTEALAKAIRGREAKLEISPESADAFRREVGRTLREAITRADDARLEATLRAGADLLSLDDLALLGHRTDAVGKAATRAAIGAARAGDGARLSSAFAPTDDDELERMLLARCRALGADVDRDRLARAMRRGEEAPNDEERTRLYEEAARGLVKLDRDPTLRALEAAARGEDSLLRASALVVLGDFAPAESLGLFSAALESPDRSVYFGGARGAVLGDAEGIVPRLVAELSHGAHARAAARALALTGKHAIADLLGVLSRAGDASSFSAATVVRVARVLARLGPEACEAALGRIADLGFRAGSALAHALASAPESSARRVDPRVVAAAMDHTVRRAEALTRAHGAMGHGLAHAEIALRVGEVAHRMLDLAAVLGDRKLVARARAGLVGDARTRGNALELLENILPRPLASRTVALLEWTGEVREASGEVEDGVLDEWLSLCHAFDSGKLGAADPMLPILDKLTLLRESSLFAGLAGEELYPVAEIAERVTYGVGESVVKEGDPGDAVFVVLEGTLRVSREGRELREINRGATFGEMALLDGAPRSATIDTVTSAALLRIPREEFEGLLDESPELAKGVIRTLLAHLRGIG